MFMAGTSNGGGACGPGGPVTGSCTPRKFSEKIALLTQRQAEDTAAFQEVMMDMTSTRLQVQRVQQARGLGPYYGGSLPNVNQIGRNPAELQGQPTCGPDAGCSARHHPMGERIQGDGRVCLPIRPIRRHTNSPYHSVHLSPPDPSWKRNWCSVSPQLNKSPLLQPPITALNRTNSDSALHTSLRNTDTGALSPTHTHTARNRHSVFPYPVPPIEENVLEEGPLSRSNGKSPALASRHKSTGIPGINILPSPDHQLSSGLLSIQSALSASGSLPDLSSLHLPSPQPATEHRSKQLQAGTATLGTTSLGTACSTGRLPQSINDMGGQGEEFNLPGLSVSLQGSLSNPLLPSSHSNPNIQTSLSSHSLPASLSSASLNLSLSNRSLQSSPSNQSLQSFHSSSSLSSQSIQSAASLCSYSSGIGGSRSCSSSSLCGSPRQTSQSQVSLARRRAPLSPLVVPIGGESRWHQTKQFSPVSSPTLSSITQGVLLNTQLLKDPRPPVYSLSPSGQPQNKAQFLPQTQLDTSCTQIQPNPLSPSQYAGLPSQQHPPQHGLELGQLPPLHQQEDPHASRPPYQHGGPTHPQVHGHQKDGETRHCETLSQDEQRKHQEQEHIISQQQQQQQQQDSYQQQQQPLSQELSFLQPHPHQNQEVPKLHQLPQIHTLQDPRQLQTGPQTHQQQQQYQYHSQQQHPQLGQTSDFPLTHYQVNRGLSESLHHYSNQQHPLFYPQQTHPRDPQIHNALQFQQFPLCQQQPIQNGRTPQQRLCQQQQQQQIQDGGQFQLYQLCQQQQSQDGRQFHQYQLCQQQQAQQCPQDGRPFLSQQGHQFQQQHPAQQYWPNQELPPYNQTSVQSLDLKSQSGCAPTMPGAEARQETARRQYQTPNQQGKTWAQQKLQAQKKQSQQAGSCLDTAAQGLSDDCQRDVEPLQHQPYIGLHLTPSQTEALAQQLGPLSKLPVWGDSLSPVPLISSERDQDYQCSLQTNLPMGYEDMSSCLSLYGFQSQSDPFSLDDVTLNIDPLGLEELSMLADGHVVEDT